MRIVPLKIEDQKEAERLFLSLGVSKEAKGILSSKCIFFNFKIEGISSWEANIIKQYLLSVGSDCAIPRQALIEKRKVDVCLFGSLTQLKRLGQKLANQPFNLKRIGVELLKVIDNFNRKEFILTVRKKSFKIDKPLICGIINLTPDSFSGNGLLSLNLPRDRLKYLVLKKVEGMLKAGVFMVDIGGESSRPFSKAIKQNEEIDRVIPFLKAIRKEFKSLLISIDTYKYKVAKAAVDEGVDIINDITAFRRHPPLIDLVKQYNLGCVLMHMKGTPQTMQISPYYRDLFGELLDFFKERLDFCLAKGINHEQIMLDPGIGFGKRLEDNLKIIRELYKLKIFGLPIFLGVSRKSFIGKILNLEPQKRLGGTLSANIISVFNGANILRVHDIEETRQVIDIFNAVYKS